MIFLVKPFAFLTLAMAFGLLFYGCGSGGGYGSGDNPTPASPDDALVAAECGRCHRSRTPHINSVADLRKANAAEKIVTGKMPPDRPLAQETKAKLTALATGGAQ